MNTQRETRREIGRGLCHSPLLCFAGEQTPLRQMSAQQLQELRYQRVISSIDYVTPRPVPTLVEMLRQVIPQLVKRARDGQNMQDAAKEVAQQKGRGHEGCQGCRRHQKGANNGSGNDKRLWLSVKDPLFPLPSSSSSSSSSPSCSPCCGSWSCGCCNAYGCASCCDCGWDAECECEAVECLLQTLLAAWREVVQEERREEQKSQQKDDGGCRKPWDKGKLSDYVVASSANPFVNAQLLRRFNAVPELSGCAAVDYSDVKAYDVCYKYDLARQMVLERYPATRVVAIQGSLASPALVAASSQGRSSHCV